MAMDAGRKGEAYGSVDPKSDELAINIFSKRGVHSRVVEPTSIELVENVLGLEDR